MKNSFAWYLFKGFLGFVGSMLALPFVLLAVVALAPVAALVEAHERVKRAQAMQESSDD